MPCDFSPKSGLAEWTEFTVIAAADTLPSSRTFELNGEKITIKIVIYNKHGQRATAVDNGYPPGGKIVATLNYNNVLLFRLFVLFSLGKLLYNSRIVIRRF